MSNATSMANYNATSKAIYDASSKATYDKYVATSKATYDARSIFTIDNNTIINVIDNLGNESKIEVIELVDLNNRKIYLPLNFWFCNDSGLALPLVSMIHNDIKIHVEFNDFDLCFKQSPTHYINVNDTICLFKPNEIITQVYNSNIIYGRFIYFDFINQNIYYNKIRGDFIIPSNNQKIPIIGQESLYETNINVTTTVVKDESYPNSFKI